MLLDVVHVAVQSEFTLVIEFENGEQRAFNMLPFMEQKPWVKLKCNNAFHGAFVDNGTVVWPGNIDIDPETLYELSVPLPCARTVVDSPQAIHRNGTAELG